ncbi:uncharacterized protein LOC141980426 [Natator depressus]|uniref:uncharacterized protein LOC141980426 n=1 Tax=Natator depressus TaxID=27790 RepID=UPI003EC029C5
MGREFRELQAEEKLEEVELSRLDIPGKEVMRTESSPEVRWKVSESSESVNPVDARQDLSSWERSSCRYFVLCPVSPNSPSLVEASLLLSQVADKGGSGPVTTTLSSLPRAWRVRRWVRDDTEHPPSIAPSPEQELIEELLDDSPPGAILANCLIAVGNLSTMTPALEPELETHLLRAALHAVFTLSMEKDPTQVQDLHRVLPDILDAMLGNLLAESPGTNRLHYILEALSQPLRYILQPAQLREQCGQVISSCETKQHGSH